MKGLKHGGNCVGTPVTAFISILLIIESVINKVFCPEGRGKEGTQVVSVTGEDDGVTL